MSYFMTTLKERPDNVVIFGLDNISRIDLVGDAAGISLKGHSGQIRITKENFDKLRVHLKVQNLKDLPKVMRQTEQR